VGARKEGCEAAPKPGLRKAADSEILHRRAKTKTRKMIYQNTFDILGDPAPHEAASAREYAREFLPMFVQDEDVSRPGTWYRIDDWAPMTTGHTREIEWQLRLFAATEDQQPYEWDPDTVSGVIEEERLLDFLEEAVQPVAARPGGHPQNE
jgi:hypothetical protein